MEFTEIGTQEYDIWDCFVDKSPQGSIYAKTWYLNALLKNFSIHVLRNNEIIQGGIVLIKNEINTYSNPLFAKYLGILLRPFEGKDGNTQSRQKKIIETIVENCRKIKTFDYTFHPAFTNWLPFYWEGYQQTTRYTYIIDCSVSSEEIYENYATRVKGDIRKAESNRISVREHTELESFYLVNSKSFERQGGPIPFSYEFFSSYYAALAKRNALKLFSASDPDGRIHAVAGCIYDRKSCNLILNGIDPEFSNLKGNTLLIHSLIRFALEHSGCFDFEGSMIKPIERFYRSFGGRQVQYFNIWKGNMINSLKRNMIQKYKKIRYGK